MENIWLSGFDDTWIPLIAALPLKSFYVACEFFMQIFQLPHSFPCLTHLELMGALGDADPSAALVALPQLTHFSFSDSIVVPICPHLLNSCIGLRVVVYLDEYTLRDYYPQYVDGLARDARFVILACYSFVHDWYMGAHRGEDYWRRTEIFIAKRQSGEIDRACIHSVFLK
jgi:hypothetical protein